MKIATVCTGIGSPEMAIRNLGIEHEITFACEIDKYARETYLANFDAKRMLTDMTKESWEGEEFYSDLFIGGIPCQAFSLAGKRLGELDPRGLLFFDFYRYVKNQKPKYFIIENVKGLLSSKSCITYENSLYLLLHNFNEIKEWEQLNFQKNSLSTLGQTISIYLLQNFAKKLNLKMDKSATSFNTKSELSYERLETKVKSGLKRRLKFLEERICQITKKSNFYPQELTVPLGCKEADLVLNQKQSYLIENLIPMVTRILEKTVDINANTSLFANNILEDNSKNGKLYTTLTELNSTTELKTFMYVLESNIIRLIILALDLSPNLWKEIWLILTQKKEFIGLKTFDIWKSRLKNLMYNLHWQVLNTKDYGLPQNRERVFLIGIRNDLPNSFVFPKGVPLKLRLKDILEQEVDEKYYLSDKMHDYLRLNNKSNGGRSLDFTNADEKEIANCLQAVYYKTPTDGEYIKVPSATASGYEIATENSGLGVFGNNKEEQHVKDIENALCLKASNTVNPRSGGTTLIKETSCNQGVMIGAMRGRNPENKSDRTPGAPTQQMLEINENGISNYLTSVQKDNLVIENKIQNYGTETETNATEILRLLFTTVSEETIKEWRSYVASTLQQDGLLQSGMYEESLFNKSNQNGRNNHSQQPSESTAIETKRMLRDLWKRECYRCSPQRRESIKQLFRQFTKTLSVMPYKSTQSENMHYSELQSETQGIRLLRQTLSEIQEVRKSITNDTKGAFRIRKLTVLECFRLQGFPDEFVDKNNFIKSINKQGILVYICNELKNKLLCNAKLKNVIEKQREGDIALCTIKDSESMGTQISFLNTPTEEIKNVKYQVAINLFTQKDFVYHTTTPTENMETLYTLTKEGKMLSTELSHPVEKKELGNAVDQNTDLLLKITLDESWKKEKSYITSTLIHTIMKSATCMFMNQSQNTLRCIVSYEELPKKQKQPTKTSLAMESFILKTANTSYVSSSQLYKQAGNSISVTVIQAILKNLLTV